MAMFTRVRSMEVASGGSLGASCKEVARFNATHRLSGVIGSRRLIAPDEEPHNIEDARKGQLYNRTDKTVVLTHSTIE
jgi:hypothetical protein